MPDAAPSDPAITVQTAETSISAPAPETFSTSAETIDSVISGVKRLAYICVGGLVCLGVSKMIFSSINAPDPVIISALSTMGAAAIGTLSSMLNSLKQSNRQPPKQ